MPIVYSDRELLKKLIVYSVISLSLLRTKKTHTGAVKLVLILDVLKWTGTLSLVKRYPWP